MSLRLSVDANQDDIEKALSFVSFVGGNVDLAIRVGINNTVRQARSGTSFPNGSLSRRIRDEVNLKASYVREQLKMNLATRSFLRGRLYAQGRGRLLSRYSTDPEIRGDKVSLLKAPKVDPNDIKVEVTPGNRTVVDPPPDVTGNLFYVILPYSNVVAIAGRKSTPGPKGGKLKVLYGPSLVQVGATLVEKGNVPFTPDAANRYRTNLLDAMRFVLAKQYPQESSVI